MIALCESHCGDRGLVAGFSLCITGPAERLVAGEKLPRFVESTAVKVDLQRYACMY
jgi:hypothetical protein